VEGLHLCSKIRGVKKSEARMVTSAILGCFKDNEVTRNEFMNHISRDTSSINL
jgi:GTP cyclohydrolase I